MYAIGARVYVKSQEAIGYIAEANWNTNHKPRYASYLVEFRGIRGEFQSDFLTTSEDLRRADFQCDGCDRWLPHGSSGGGPKD